MTKSAGRQVLLVLVGLRPTSDDATPPPGIMRIWSRYAPCVLKRLPSGGPGVRHPSAPLDHHAASAVCAGRRHRCGVLDSRSPPSGASCVCAAEDQRHLAACGSPPASSSVISPAPLAPLHPRAPSGRWSIARTACPSRYVHSITHVRSLPWGLGLVTPRVIFHLENERRMPRCSLPPDAVFNGTPRSVAGAQHSR
ncbi:hypothetical protein FB451DRAFT_1228863 [Mycena latifolia]|nr:hypothetical protein FB451DRAFT_1228863 [Mycena latifolia]